MWYITIKIVTLNIFSHGGQETDYQNAGIMESIIIFLLQRNQLRSALRESGSHYSMNKV